MSTNTNQPIDPEGTIPVKEAIQMAANWRNYLSTSEQEFQARSFQIPIVNFKNILLHNPDAESVHAYIGLRTATDPATAQLILVPVVDGKDVLYLPNERKSLISEEQEDQSNTYDLTKVCPPNCSTGEMND
jgi:hypothetical protein